MANIFQEIFLSPKECQLIDMINSSKNIKTYGKQDKNFRETSTTYCIRRSDMNVVATHRWHCAQGDLYTLDISHTGIPQNIASQYDQEN